MSDIYFLGGLPRSGNTLLSSLLNQNHEVYVSPISPLLDNLLSAESMLENNEITLSVDFVSNTTSALKHFTKGFYSCVEKPFIIDRHKSWGSKQSIFTAIKYITETPKVIYTVRDIPSILTSFLSLIKEKEDNFIDNNLRQLQMKPYGNQTQNDLRCDWLMNGQVGFSLTTLTELLQIKVPVCLVEYDDLVKYPQKKLNDIYDFLQLPHFIHNFDNVEKKESETLSKAGLPSDLHDVRKKVKNIALDPSLILTAHTLQKYSGLEFWRN